MTTNQIIASVKDELDSRQIVVRFDVTDRGVIVHAEDAASRLIAKAELRKRGFKVL